MFDEETKTLTPNYLIEKAGNGYLVTITRQPKTFIAGFAETIKSVVSELNEEEDWINKMQDRLYDEDKPKGAPTFEKMVFKDRIDMMAWFAEELERLENERENQ